MRRALSKYWDTAAAVACAVMASLWLTRPVVDSITTEIIAFFTIQAAVILPAMIFSAGLLRGQGLTLEEVERYQRALRAQMYFWVTLLFLDLAAVTFLIVGKAAAWRWKVTIHGHVAEMSWLLFFCATLVGALSIFRMVPFVRGVMSLMELNGWLVRKSVESAAPTQTRLPPAAPLELPEGYGKILPHSRKRDRKAR